MTGWMKVVEESWKDIPKDVFCEGGTKTIAERANIAYGEKEIARGGNDLTDEELEVVESMRHNRDGKIPVLPFS